MDNSSAQNDGLKPNSTPEEVARALINDLASVAEQYGLHVQSQLHPQVIAIAMVKGLEVAVATIQAETAARNQAPQSKAN